MLLLLAFLLLLMVVVVVFFNCFLGCFSMIIWTPAVLSAFFFFFLV